MMRDRLIYGAVAAVAGILVGVGAILVSGAVAGENKPATEVNSFDASNGFVQGSVEYGTRDGSDRG
ncbi:DUF2613 domain-containing protein [Gordonia sp. VNK21]|uniref:DUF2613 domain-containing protein n=1 Tax=Gordonia sp. VNK21 TaxID=3382483 RepID=UPI0038D40D83